MRTQGLLIDIDGVLVVSWAALPGTLEAYVRLRDAGVPMRLVTNTTSRTRASITEALQGAGFPVGLDDVITVAGAAAAYVRANHPGARCLLLNSGDLSSELPGVTLVPPDADPRTVDVVLVGSAGPEFTHAALNHALACLLEGAVLVALQRNLVWQTTEGLALDAGAFVLALEQAARTEAVVIGKPAPALFEAGLAALGLGPGDVAMIGDDLDSDVRGGMTAGMTGVLVRTGKFREAQLGDDGPAPDVVLESFADVPGWLGLG
ncbi:HAD-superfamily subfamily IIA hydrolase, TIGR01458 [Raineyella antarctica]|uniref:HAD-superfamily subfamily IIA hydrolase, TIGR01458 n=1 Tax=Raineyella antarctica TaxID=1577474 RepID=A0A1G6ILS9_9ACTN|nr:HAD-IIA family hydrolase [Raineyella antarctica]SDC07403.1 HAD-superfamily subfamily IIA hydrolase, TIGR01458 [Raineyella antarctica]